MDRRSRAYKRNTSSSFTICNDKITEEDVSNSSGSDNNSQQSSECEISLEVQIAESLERLLTKPNKHNSGLFDVKLSKNGTNDQSSDKILLNKLDSALEAKYRKQLLEKCKLKLMANSSNQSLHCNNSSHKIAQRTCDDKNYARRRDLCGDEKRSVNSAPLNPHLIHVPGPSNVVHSGESVQDNDNYYSYNNNRINFKRGREMGDYWPSEKSLDNHSESLNRLKRRLVSKRDTDIGDTLRQVYTTARTSNLRELLKCQNPNRHKEDPKHPCMCQHCGIADVLMESQKRPFIEDSYEALPDFNRREDWAPNRSLRSRTELLRNPEVNKTVLDELCERMKIIESTLNGQEERFVTKDYLKLVVDKLISYISPKAERNTKTSSKSKTKKNISIQCNSKPVRHHHHHKDTPTVTSVSPKRKLIDQCVGSVLSVNKPKSATPSISVNEAVKIHVARKTPTVSSTKYNNFTTASTCKDMFWKWGEETIKPGLDLKSKIVQLINETVSGSKSLKVDNTGDKRIDINIDTSSEKTLYLYGSETQERTPSSLKDSSYSLRSGGNFRKMLDYMSEKIYADYISKDAIDKTSRTKTSRNTNRAMNDDLFKRNVHNAKKKTESLRTVGIEKSELNRSLKTSNAEKRNCNSDFPIEKKKDNALNVVKKDTPKTNKSLIPKYKKHYKGGCQTNAEGKVHVTYMSPKMELAKDSCTCFKVEKYFKRYIENGCCGRINSSGKLEFLCST